MDIILFHYKTIILTLMVFNLIMAVSFLLWSDLLMRTNEILKKEISLKKLADLLNTVVKDIDKPVIEMRKVIGGICVALTLVLTFLFFYT